MLGQVGEREYNQPTFQFREENGYAGKEKIRIHDQTVSELSKIGKKVYNYAILFTMIAHYES